MDDGKHRRGDHAALIDRVRAGLDDGTISERDLERIVMAPRDRHRTMEEALVAVGALVVLAGILLLYAVNFASLSHAMQLVTPFAFPLVLLGATALAIVRGRSRWLQEAMTGITALATLIASEVSVSVLRSDDIREWYVLGCAVASSTIAAAMLRSSSRHLALAWWWLSASLVLAIGTASWISGLEEARLRWPALVVGFAYVGVGAMLARRGTPRPASAFAALGTALLIVASIIGITHNDTGMADALQLTPWHAFFTLVIMVAIIAGASSGLFEVAVVGGFGVLAWIGFAVQLVDRQPLWALAIIGFGAATIAGTVWATRRRDRRDAAG